MSHTESYSRVNVIKVKMVHEMWLVWVCESVCGRDRLVKVFYH